MVNTPLASYIITHTALAGRPGAGPAIAISMILVAFVCALTGLCYAELASMIPIAGSAYTYTYATLGELIAWIIGWDLILEYAGSNMSVSVGFAAHVVDLLDWFGLHPSARWISPAYLPSGLQDLSGNNLYTPGWHFGFNIPAFLIVMILTVVLVRGIRESASTNNMMVGFKLIAILIFIFAVIGYIHPSNWHPFMPNGWSGVLTGGSIMWMSLAAAAVMLGHCYPVFLKFQGGKAVACFIGAFLFLAPWPLLAVLLLFAIVVAETRHISLGSIVAAGLFPLAVWLIEHPPAPLLLVSIFAGVLIVYRHKTNLQRIHAGNENVFRF